MSIMEPSIKPDTPAGTLIRSWNSRGASDEFCTDATRRALTGSTNELICTGRSSTPRTIAKMRSVPASRPAEGLIKRAGRKEQRAYVPFHHAGSCNETRTDWRKGMGTLTCHPPNSEFFPNQSLSHGAVGSAFPTNAAWLICRVTEALASPSR